YLDPKSNKFQFVPWDLDSSFGRMGMGQDLDNLSINQPWRGQNRFLERVYKVDAFKSLYIKYMTEFSKTIFKPERITAQVAEVASAIRPAIAQEDKNKLERFEYMVTGTGDPNAGGGAENERGPGGRGGPGRVTAKSIQTFAEARAKSVEAQLAGKEVPAAPDNGRGPGGPPRGGPGGPGGFGRGPEGMEPQIFAKLDTDKDDKISKQEWMAETTGLFKKWDAEKTGFLTEEQLKTGITKDALPAPPGGGQGPGQQGGDRPPRPPGDEKQRPGGEAKDGAQPGQQPPPPPPRDQA
ncbi:MAG TPA: CotH kinase family protein, partial [Candidatus Methylacidiphilales bacterium]|nr:CotH kinase family protein [Candidatus Methylacidiphilales bacterium]